MIKQTEFDLEERTAKFGEAVIKMVHGIKQNAINSPLITQLVKCATSIGANYCEANNAKAELILNTKSAFAKRNHARPFTF